MGDALVSCIRGGGLWHPDCIIAMGMPWGDVRYSRITNGSAEPGMSPAYSKRHAKGFKTTTNPLSYMVGKGGRVKIWDILSGYPTL